MMTPYEENVCRRYLWFNHGCNVGILYGDDGEMQCNNTSIHAPIDFKRNSIIRIFGELAKIKPINCGRMEEPINAEKAYDICVDMEADRDKVSNDELEIRQALLHRIELLECRIRASAIWRA